jgi:hypothetical protein
MFFFAAYKQLPDSAYAARDNAPIDLFPKLAYEPKLLIERTQQIQLPKDRLPGKVYTVHAQIIQKIDILGTCAHNT